jgi:hypothetical protein
MDAQTEQENRTKMLKALIQNYGFKIMKNNKMPTINLVYPSYTADGNTEEFRFSESLCRELSARASIVKTDLSDKLIVWTNDEDTVIGLDKLIPRMRLEEQTKINSIYSYAPLLVVGAGDESLSAYIVKPIVDGRIAWFELTGEEKGKIEKHLSEKAEARPYRNLIQRIFSGVRK